MIIGDNMEDDNKMIVTDEEGNTKEYEVLLSFKWYQTSKNYIVYTDNTKNEEDELNVYASIYDPEDLTKLDPVETDDEWQEIEFQLEDKLGVA